MSGHTEDGPNLRALHIARPHIASALNKKRRSMTDASSVLWVGLDGANLVRLGALRALGGFEFHPLPFVQ